MAISISYEVLDVSRIEHATALAWIIGETSSTWKPTAAEIQEDFASTPAYVAELGYVALISDEPVGYGLVGNYRYINEPWHYLERVRVVPSYRRRGCWFCVGVEIGRMGAGKGARAIVCHNRT
jgi:hypothetical protein